MEKRQLYPLKFKPIVSEMPWGKTSLLIADLNCGESEVKNGWLEGNSIDDVMETYLERIVGENIYNFLGRQFPLTVELMEVDGRTPLTVHPDDEIGMDRYDALGKAKMWFVLEADENAAIYAGFKQDIDALKLYENLKDGSIEDTLNMIQPKKGDALYIRPGTLHFAKGRMVMAAVQEASEMDFRVYDWDRGFDDAAEDQLSEALDFIDYTAFDPCHHIEGHCCCGEHQHEEGHECHCGGHHHGHAHEDKAVEHIVEAQEFTVNKLKLNDPQHIYTEKFGKCIIYFCIRGGASIQLPYTDEKGVKQSENYYLNKGGAILIPADMQDFFLVPMEQKTRLLEILPEGFVDEDYE